MAVTRVVVLDACSEGPRTRPYAGDQTSVSPKLAGAAERSTDAQTIFMADATANVTFGAPRTRVTCRFQVNSAR